MSKLIIKQVKSSIGRTKNQKLTLEALGLKRINDTVEHKDEASIKGMIRKVNHLVTVEEKK